ncbi:hypothetical protein N7471_004329 [Penicillium samsonianum]|uniref:uncharacterized protein n=1 Tax=Penicillium samsonianum TaxID=1882272 RepID=UPI00254759AD|nr:uncharacterized protein N7471_004329 [Penicillium samsonianum]KAJ6137843.1 hypothetical protein N7471_004329 [Penicillium samsonianum]
MGNPRREFLKVSIRWSTMRNCEDVARLVMKTQGRSSTRVADQREGKKGKQVLVWNRDSSRSERVGMGGKWTKRRTGGTGGNQHRPTQQESKAFGHQRQMDSIRWPAPDCGLERMRAVVGWIGTVTGIMQLPSRTRPSLLSSLHNGKKIRG